VECEIDDFEHDQSRFSKTLVAVVYRQLDVTVAIVLGLVRYGYGPSQNIYRDILCGKVGILCKSRKCSFVSAFQCDFHFTLRTVFPDDPEENFPDGFVGSICLDRCF